ncbi:MAG TPA: translocation/assembly module TamB domain-containing protein, partial [Gemmatimonadaceae bacterium]|nr:translocation/assembly module TamB domain-containing protein [Gemmatimonadaceae bacterium]
KPVPVAWQGTVTGTVRGRGGPLNRFEVDEAQFTFRDAHVPGAVTRGSARGGLDILFPALTVFRGLDVDVERLDLRTIANLFPNFPRIGGTLVGRATLDSSWLDVRFSNADVTHSIGAGAPSRATGSGRVTWGEQFMTYDVAVEAAPVTLETFLAQYQLPLRGQLAGPVHAKGTVEDLDLSLALEGSGGRIVFDGQVDAFPPRLRARGVGRVAGLDVRAFVTDSRAPATALTTRFDVDLGGDSLIDLDGRLALDAERSSVAGLLVYPSAARLRFGAGRVFVDSLGLETSAARLDAHGALGLYRGVSDSLRYWVLVDSLGGLRRFITRPTLAARPELDPGAGRAVPPPDSLLGSIQVAGVARGSIDSIDAGGTLRGSRLFVNGNRAQAVRGEYALEDVMGRRRGTATVIADTAVAAGIRLATAEGRVRLDAPERGRVSVTVQSASGPTITASADVARVAPGRQELLVDTLTLAVRDHAWRLVAPARASVGTDGFAVDSVVVRDPDGGAAALAGRVPNVGAVDLTMRADSVSLAELGDLVQSASSLGGLATFRGRVTGTRAAPVLEARASADSVRVGEVRLQSLRARASYAGRRLGAEVDLFRDSVRVARATASLPVDLALAPVPRRLLDDSLRVRASAERVDLSLLETTTPAVRSATGLLDVDLNVSGTWQRPRLAGSLSVLGGALAVVPLGIRLTDVNADVRVADDVVTVRRLALRSVGPGATEGDASLRGTIELGRRADPVFDLTATLRRFEAVSLPRTARLELSTGGDGLRLAGPYRRAHVTGTVIVDRGEIRIPELVQKRVINLDDPDFYNIVDTSLTTNNRLVRAPSAFVDSLALDNVRLQIGDNVWLRSAEANIQLGGEVEVNRSPGTRRDEEPTITLFGELSADRGTYTLNLGEFVQRSFTVDRGRLIFSGGRDLNPALDISAVHTIRQTRTNDNLRVRATIRGTFARPRLELSSDEAYEISQSDLLSYLVTGAPSYELSSGSSANLAASTVLRSAGAIFSGWGQQYTGGLIDIIDIQTAGALEQRSQEGYLEAIRSSRIGVGKQILDGRAFLSANSGLCSIGGGSGSGGDQVTFTDAIGLRLEARLPKGYSLEVSQEPASTALLCGRSSARGLAPTPKQVGFDLFRTWQF